MYATLISRILLMQDAKIPVHAGYEPLQAEPTSTRRGWWRRLLMAALCSVGLGYLVLTFQATVCSRDLKTTVVETGELIWNHITAQEADSLDWVKCYNDEFECARLQVPLDYSNPSLGHAGIALAKYPAKVSHDHPEYRGAVLFNFGGPGISGISLITVTAEPFQELIGYEYDIVGFDPRGVSRTTPQIHYFSEKVEGVAYRMKTAEDPVLNTTEDSFSRTHSRFSTLGDIAQHSSANETVPYTSTALVARDMLSINKAMGNDKLQYWGFSYGTVLGATFAAMFPDQVGRIIIDGVVDAEDYYSMMWKALAIDTDKSLRWFLEACVDAGPEKCALYESTVQGVHARIHKLFNNLKKNPVPVFAPNLPSTMQYALIDYRTVKTILLSLLYAPYAPGVLNARRVSSAFHDLENGDGTALWTVLSLFAERPVCECPAPGHPLPPDLFTPNAPHAILCADGDEVRDSVDEFRKHFDKLAEHTEFADIATVRGNCIGAKIRPVERFTGPFVANTSFPLLLIGNSADPVTPLASAHKMAKGFNGSVVLNQDSAGHCSIAASSFCTAKAVRAYFRNGKLPEPGTVCDVSSHIFGGDRLEDYSDLVGEDKVVMNAWREISHSVKLQPTIPLLNLPLAVV